jgi:nucleotide-binding universal stress UspA family protein
MRILIATDGSPHSEAAIDTVRGRPWPEGTSVRVVTAANYPYPLATYQWYAPEQALAAFDEQSKQQARSIAEAAATRLRERGFSVEAVVREGDARVEIVMEASDWNADLVIVGSHGYTGLRKLLLGSVAQYVVSHAPCSVEVVRRREESPGG